MSIAYGVIFALSLLMPPLYFTCVRKKQNEPWLLVLFISISTVTLGYLLISISKQVEFAIFANKIAYLGQVFIPLCMFMLISKLCGFSHKKWLTITLIILAVIMFALVCTTGYLDWYYTDVTLGNESGATYLIKEYGVLHPTNLIYVVGYFVTMIVLTAISLAKTRETAQKIAGFMLIIVLGNIAMWLTEKLVVWNFELLAISYLMSEFAFFFLYYLLQDYVLKSEIPPTQEKTRVIFINSIPKTEKLERVLKLLPAGKTLTTRQMEILEGILDGKTQKEIANDLHISENTVKWHTGLLYTTLNVSGKEEIFRLFK